MKGLKKSREEKIWDSWKAENKCYPLSAGGMGLKLTTMVVTHAPNACER